MNSRDKSSDVQYGECEAKTRFEKLVKAALNTPPKPLKSVRRRPKSEKKKPKD